LAEAPLIDAENLFRQPGPLQPAGERRNLERLRSANRRSLLSRCLQPSAVTERCQLDRPRILSRHGPCGVATMVWTSAAAEKPTKHLDARPRVHRVATSVKCWA